MGCGEVSEVHLKALADISSCTVAGVCDKNKEKAELLAEKFNVPHIYQNLDSMLNSEDTDAIHVLTPPQTHRDLVLKALTSGSHVLTEKPFCMNLKEADEMIKAAESNDVRLGVVHSYLYIPAIQKALRKVKKGEIGKLVRTDTLVSLYGIAQASEHPQWIRDLPGGVFGEILPHALYVTLAFSGDVEEVSCYANRPENPTSEEPFSELDILLNSGGKRSSLHLSSRIKTSFAVFLVRLIGTEKILEIRLPSNSLIEWEPSSTRSLLSRAKFNLGPAGSLLKETFFSAESFLRGKVSRGMTHKKLIQSFLKSVVSEESLPPLLRAERGREVVKSTEMIWRQAL